MAAAAIILWWFRYEWSARAFDWHLFGASLAKLRWPWLLVALVPIFGTYYGRALRWAVLLKPVKPEPSLRNLLSATIIGFTAITLFGRPGEFVRPYLIAVKERVSVPSQLAAWVVERIFDILMALLVFAYALTRVRTSGLTVGPTLAWVLAVGGKVVALTCIALFVLLLLFRHFAEPMRGRLMSALHFLPEHQFLRMERLIANFVQGVESTRSDGSLFLVFAYSAIEWVLIAGCYWCLAQAFAGTVNLNLVDVLIFMGFVSFGAAVQIPGVGGGMQVVAVLVLTELFGVRFELATTFALVIWIFTFVAIVPIGLALALKDGLNWHNLRQIGREASS
ncbi:MAG TPA: lysylphosphatidylglycerol synthase transmembrane domain-containing protein [Bryobacteraceae bacterium]|nr:lysylphosphatidylglycerol synthase transmembrane domain-containing protein [Bryobacteraceae bacterium]